MSFDVNPILEAQGVGKAFHRYGSEWSRVATWFGAKTRPIDSHWALRDITFSVGRGESIGLVGRNGAGKSTLLKLISGTLRASEGTLQVHGRVAAILELGMGFNAEFTGRQNAFHSAGLMGYEREEIDAAMPSIERFADIGAYFDQPGRIYSSGMQMRVAFAVATAFSPQLLLIDEALAVGDVSFQAKCYTRIAEMQAEGCAFVFVSHSVEEIVKHCERALFVDEGRLAMDGSSRDVTNAYLDHLWGKRATAVSPSVAVPVQFGPEGGERYETRPLYRPEERRFGKGGAKITDFHLDAAGQAFPVPIPSGARLRIVMQVRFERDVASPVYGLLVKTHDGVFLFGTNSRIACATAPTSVSAGTTVDVEFVLPMALNSGAFLLSLGVSSDEGMDELVALDRRYDSILVQVLQEKPIWGIVDMDAQCRFEVRRGHDRG